MAKNLGSITNSVLRRLGRGRASNSYLVATVKAQVQDNFAYLCGLRDWEWKRGYAPLAITATDTALSLPTVSKGGEDVAVFSRVEFCQLQTTGQVLHPRPDMLDLIMRGTSLSLSGRGHPTAWGMTVDGLTGERKLLLMPLPGYADTLLIWGQRSASAMALLEDADEPPFPDEYGGWLIEQTVADLSGADATVDPTVTRMALSKAQSIFRAMCHTEAMASPPVQSVRWPGHGVFGA